MGVAGDMQTGSAMSCWLPCLCTISDTRTSQVGSEPPPSLRASSNALLRPLAVRVTASPMGSIGGGPAMPQNISDRIVRYQILFPASNLSKSRIGRLEGAQAEQVQGLGEVVGDEMGRGQAS